MNEALLGSIAATGLTVAFLHAALPTHWLPFVLAGRRQGWARDKTLAIAALAGSGHVLFTIVLGAMIAWFGIAMDSWIGNVFPYIAAGILIAFGVYYLVSGSDDHHHFVGHAHHHGHHRSHDHDHRTITIMTTRTKPTVTFTRPRSATATSNTTSRRRNSATERLSPVCWRPLRSRRAKASCRCSWPARNSAGRGSWCCA